VRSLDVTFTPRTRSHRRRRIAALVVVLGALAAGWFFLAPTGIGGDTTYVVTDGISMHPRIHTGDLALVRPASSYHVGDIVAYRNPELHVVVLHRIHSISPSGRYRFKGDNNSWIDPGSVASSAIVGKMWVLAPGLGGDLHSLHSPPVMGTMAAVAVLLLFGGAGAEVRRRRRRGRPKPKWKAEEPKWKGAPAPPRAARADNAPAARAAAPTPPKPPTLVPPPANVRRPPAGPSYGGIAAAAAAVLACAGLTIFAWASPTSRSAPSQTSYAQSGRFSYSASTLAGAVYDTDRVTTGQPMFSRLVGPVQVRFDYRLRAAQLQGAGGTASLDAVVSAQNGWSRTVVLQGPTSFTGRHATVAGVIHLRRLQRLVEKVAVATSVPSVDFTLTLVPSVKAHGVLAGHPFAAGYAPKLPFSLTSYELAPVLNAAAAAAGPADAGSAAVFHPSQNASVAAAGSARVMLGPAVFHLSAGFARILGPIGLLAALAAAALAAWQLRRDRRADEPTRIQSRYGEAMIAAVQSTLIHGGDLVEVESIEALARLAERYQSLMIHEQTATGHAYLVADNGTVYAYFVQTSESEPALRERLARGEGLRADASAA
jgi:signal peptidase I